MVPPRTFKGNDLHEIQTELQAQFHYHDYVPTGMEKPTKLYHYHTGNKVIEDGVVTHNHDVDEPHYVDIGHWNDHEPPTPPDRSSRKRTTDQIVAATKPPGKQSCSTSDCWNDYECW